MRKSPTRRNNILIVCNFTPVARPDYRVGVPKKKQYKLIRDEQGLLPKGKVFKAEKKNCDNREFSFAYPLEAYGVGNIYILIFCIAKSLKENIKDKNKKYRRSVYL